MYRIAVVYSADDCHIQAANVQEYSNFKHSVDFNCRLLSGIIETTRWELHPRLKKDIRTPTTAVAIGPTVDRNNASRRATCSPKGLLYMGQRKVQSKKLPDPQSLCFKNVIWGCTTLRCRRVRPSSSSGHWRNGFLFTEPGRGEE